MRMAAAAELTFAEVRAGPTVEKVVESRDAQNSLKGDRSARVGEKLDKQSAEPAQGARYSRVASQGAFFLDPVRISRLFSVARFRPLDN
jgi:hypothetical protein